MGHERRCGTARRVLLVAERRSAKTGQATHQASVRGGGWNRRTCRNDDPLRRRAGHCGGEARWSESRQGTVLGEVLQEGVREVEEAGNPILVVVDDIDRLHVDELLALLKVVRLLGRFDGIQYLLAYDDETLFRTLSASSIVGEGNDGSAARFVEKIVQYPLVVPPLLPYQQLSRLADGLRLDSRVTDDGSGERIAALASSFATLLRTPRAVDRYLAQLRHHLPLVPVEEIDDEDVQILTLLRGVSRRCFSRSLSIDSS